MVWSNVFASLICWTGIGFLFIFVAWQGRAGRSGRLCDTLRAVQVFGACTSLIGLAVEIAQIQLKHHSADWTVGASLSFDGIATHNVFSAFIFALFWWMLTYHEVTHAPHTHTHTHTPFNSHVQTRTHTCTHASTHAHARAQTHPPIHPCLHTHACMPACTCARI